MLFVDQPHSHIPSGLALRSADTPGVVRASRKSGSPGRQLIEHVIDGGLLDKLLRQLNREDHESDGFYHPKSGTRIMLLDGAAAN